MVSRSVSRRSVRARARLTVTAVMAQERGALVCRTRDVSDSGLFLETPVVLEPRTRLYLSLLDEERGEALELEGEVARVIPAGHAGSAGGLGIRLVTPPDAWRALVQRFAQNPRVSGIHRTARRLRVLVVGDEQRRRGALALYVTSGWDVRFASDVDSTQEALSGFRIDAVIAEHDLDDHRWPKILDAAREAQPGARRIIRAAMPPGTPPPPPGQPTDLVHRVVDLEAGLEAVLEAVSEEG